MRIRYYDYLESLAIFIVLSFHSVWLKSTVPAGIAMSLVPMAVPLFFMIHGALLFPRETTPEKQIRRFLRVLFQLFAWNAIYLLISVAIGMVQPSEVTPGYLFRYFFCKQNSAGVSSGHLWFIYALLVLYCLYPMLEVCKKHNEKVLRYIMVACFVLSFVREEVLVYSNFLCQKFFGKELVTDWLLSKVGPYFNATFWFIAGHYYSQWLKKIHCDEKKKQHILLAVGGVVLGIGLLLLERYVVFGSIKYNWKPLPDQYEKLGSFVLAFSTFALFSFIDFKDGKLYRIAKEISTHTLDIFYIHVIFARTAYEYFYTWQRANVFNNYLRALVILILSYLTGQIIRRIPVLKKLL